MEIIFWLVVFLGYAIAIFEIVKVLVFSFTLFSDVPYVPSNKEIAVVALNELNLKNGDSFIDIGSGDGKVVFLAASSTNEKVKFTGLEIRSFLVFLSNLKKLFFPKKEIHFLRSDAFKLNYSQFNKVFLYMTTDMTEQILFKLEKELKPNSKVISCVFSTGEFGKTHKVEKKEAKIGKKIYNLYVWTKK